MTGVVGALVRSEVRRHRRTVLLLAVLSAVVVLTVLTALAGSRRSRTAFDRYLDAIVPPDVLVQGEAEAVERAAGLDGVTDSVRADLFAMFPTSVGPDQFFPMFGPREDGLGTRIMRVPVVQGRAADPDEPLEVTVGERTARRLGVGAGDELPMYSMGPEQVEAIDAEDGSDLEPSGPALSLRVVGVVRDPADIGARETDISVTFLTPAFTRRYGDVIGTLAHTTFVVVEPGALARFGRAAQDVDGIEVDTLFGRESLRANVDPTMRALATGLLAFAAAAALAGGVALAQVAARAAQRSAGARLALPALGVDRRTRRLALALPLGLGVVGGALAGALASIPASALLPIGLARKAEPASGVRVDGTVLLAGTAGAVLAGAILAIVVAVLADREATGGARAAGASRLAGAVSRTAAPVTFTTGVLLALARGRGARALPVRAAVIGVGTAVAGVLVTAVFAASSDHLRTSPPLYGWGWEAQVTGAEQTGLGDEVADAVETELVRDPAVRSVTGVWFQLPTVVDDQPVPAMMVTPLKGHGGLVVVDGRSPVSGEVVVGADTLRAIGRAVGDEVEVGVLGGAPQTVRIAGVAAFPVDADGGSSALGVGFTADTGRLLGFEGGCPDELDCARIVGLGWAAGADRRAFAARLEDRGLALHEPAPPGELDSLLAVERLPFVLAGFLAAVGLVAVAYTAAVTVRRRRQDLAVLRTIGMTARDLRRVVVSQTSVLVVTGAVLGTVLGVAIGRQVWRLTVDTVHVVYAPVVPLATLAGVLGATFVVAHLAAAVPRRRLGALRPAAVLRGE